MTSMKISSQIKPKINSEKKNTESKYNLNRMRMLNVLKTAGKSFSTIKINMSITESITNKITTQLNPNHFDVINESYMHNVPKGSETHFKVLVVSDKFQGLPLIKRHRMINDLLKEELNNGVHALSIVALTADQWDSRDKEVEPSPTCRGGFGK